jgi:hypothetical protein
VLVERASRTVEDHPGKLTRNQIAEQTTGNKSALLQAIDILHREEFVTKTEENYPRYTSTKAYRETEDPRSDHRMPLGDRLRRHQDHNDADGERGDD